MAHKLSYLRKAIKAKDGKDGLLYRHTWETGTQDLIFDDKVKADSFLKEVKEHAEHVRETGMDAAHG